MCEHFQRKSHIWAVLPFGNASSQSKLNIKLAARNYLLEHTFSHWDRILLNLSLLSNWGKSIFNKGGRKIITFPNQKLLQTISSSFQARKGNFLLLFFQNLTLVFFSVDFVIILHKNWNMLSCNWAPYLCLNHVLLKICPVCGVCKKSSIFLENTGKPPGAMHHDETGRSAFALQPWHLKFIPHRWESQEKYKSVEQK